MLDSGGDSVVLVSTIPSAFIVADELVHQSPSSVPASSAAPWCSVPRQPAAAALTDDLPTTSPDRRSSDDCSEITSTVADEPSTAASVPSPSAALASPPPDVGKQSATTGKMSGVVGTELANTGQASSPVTSTAELIQPVMTSTSVTSTTTTTSQQVGRQKKSLEMVVNLLKRPSTSTTSSSAATICCTAEPAGPSLPTVGTHQSSLTSSSTKSASGHVVLNGGTCSTADDDSIRLSLLQRLVATPSPAFWQPPVPTSSHFRFRSVTGNGLMPARSETGPPIKQLKHMCKNVRSFVPSGARRPAQWRHPALDLLFGGTTPVPVTRHRAAMHFPPRAAGAYRGACVRSQDFSRPRFRAPAGHLATSGVGMSRDRKHCGEGELSALMRVLLEASGNSCHTSTSSSSSASASYPSSADLWKAAIN